MKKRFLVVLLCLVMLLSLASVSTLAATADTQTITFEKIWTDFENKNSTRPENIKVTLLRNGEVYGEAVEITADDGWKHDFMVAKDDLGDLSTGTPAAFAFKEETVPGYSEGTTVNPEVTFNPGEFVVYSKPEEGSPVEGALAKYTPCNSLVFEGVSGVVAMKKGNSYCVWSADALSEAEKNVVIEAANNVNGMNVHDVGSVLFCVGECDTDTFYYSALNSTITFKASSGWSLLGVGTYVRVPASFTVTGGSITNEWLIPTVDIAVEKEWDDADDQDDIRPDDVTITLLANGEETDYTLTLSEENSWADVFEDVPQYNEESGDAIEYSVSENPVDGYEPSIEEVEDGIFVVTNTHEPAPEPTPEPDPEPTPEPKPAVPKTGDNSALGLWISLLGVSMAVAVIVICAKKRKN